jgi:hypothetical protein
VERVVGLAAGESAADGVRYERRADILQAFPHLACALICARKLKPL